MSTVPARHPKRPVAVVPLLAIVASIVALAVVGGTFAVGIIGRSGDQPAGPALPKGPFGTAQDIPTSFGVVAVEFAEKVKGLRAKELAGMTHGIQNLVKANQMLVRADVTITNLTHGTVAYSPTQFRLLVGKDRKQVSEVRSAIQPGTLQPDAAIEGQLSYIVPRDGSRLWLAFDDPGRKAPILIDLGRTGKTPPGALKGFTHGNHN